MPVFGNAGGSDDEDDEGFDRVLEGDEAEAGPPHRPHGLAGDAHHNARDDGARVERKKGEELLSPLDGRLWMGPDRCVVAPRRFILFPYDARQVWLGARRSTGSS